MKYEKFLPLIILFYSKSRKKKQQQKQAHKLASQVTYKYKFQSKKIRGNCDQDRAWIILEKVLSFVKFAKLIMWNKILENTFHLSNFQRKVWIGGM